MGMVRTLETTVVSRVHVWYPKASAADQQNRMDNGTQFHVDLHRARLRETNEETQN